MTKLLSLKLFFCRKNIIQGRFLRIEVNSTYGDYGGLQFLQLTGLEMHSPGYNPGWKRKYLKTKLHQINLMFQKNIVKKTENQRKMQTFVRNSIVRNCPMLSKENLFPPGAQETVLAVNLELIQKLVNIYFYASEKNNDTIVL